MTFSTFLTSSLIIGRDLLKNKYYALSAASALFKYLEDKNRTFSARSLKIRYLPLEGTMLIDAETAKNLELVENVSLHSETMHFRCLIMDLACRFFFCLCLASR